MTIRWLAADDQNELKVHGFTDGFTRSLCGQAAVPISFTTDLTGHAPRCGNCQRSAVRILSAERASTEPSTQRWREAAVQATLGDGWTYEETSEMPSYRAEVDRVAVALADAYREGILQGNASTRTGN